VISLFFPVPPRRLCTRLGPPPRFSLRGVPRKCPAHPVFFMRVPLIGPPSFFFSRTLLPIEFFDDFSRSLVGIDVCFHAGNSVFGFPSTLLRGWSIFFPLLMSLDQMILPLSGVLICFAHATMSFCPFCSGLSPPLVTVSVSRLILGLVLSC